MGSHLVWMGISNLVALRSHSAFEDTGVSAGIVNFLSYSAAVASQLIGPIIAYNLGEHILFLNFTVTLLIGLIIQLLY